MPAAATDLPIATPVKTGIKGFYRAKVLIRSTVPEAREFLKSFEQKGFQMATCDQILPEHRDSCHLFAIGDDVPHPDKINFRGEQAIVGYTHGGHQMFPTLDVTLEPGVDILLIKKE